MAEEKKTGIVPIRNKDGSTTDYQTVAFRINEFRKKHPAFTIQTEVIAQEGGTIRFRAMILDESGRLLATGHAELSRKEQAGVEKCETKAIGRALAAFGLIGTEFCSADELADVLTGSYLAAEIATEWLMACADLVQLRHAWEAIEVRRAEFSATDIQTLVDLKEERKAVFTSD